MCNIRKTNDTILRKPSERRTGGQTDRHTGKSDFTGRCPTNVERPKAKKIASFFYFFKRNTCFSWIETFNTEIIMFHYKE